MLRFTYKAFKKSFAKTCLTRCGTHWKHTAQ